MIISPLDPLEKSYGRGHLALGTGAGVSVKSGMPSWTELLCRVADLIPTFGRNSVQTLLESGFDVTAIATILRIKVENDDEFAEVLRVALYEGFNYKASIGKMGDAAFAAHVKATNATLHAVGTICAVANGQGGYAPNPLIRAILTLNIDSLLQMYTRARFNKNIVRTVERASATASSKRIHVYHLHGFLRRDVTEQDRPRTVEASDRIVLTEQQYFDVVANANGFVNYSVLHALREYRFLFVGLSMSDPNLRRALHLSFCERIREYRAEGENEKDAKEKSTRHWAVLCRRNDELDSATGILLAILGVQPIWVTDLATDIPLILRQLYESHSGRWNDVS